MCQVGGDPVQVGGLRVEAQRPGLRQAEGAEVLQQPFHYRVQAAGTDVFRILVDVECNFRDAPDAAFGEFECNFLGVEQGGVLRRQRSIRLGQNTNEVFRREGLELNANGKASLQFRNQVRWLGHVERTRSNEQDVVCLDHAVLGIDRRTLDKRQQVTLHAFT